jgi:hypothetical protein
MAPAIITILKINAILFILNLFILFREVKQQTGKKVLLNLNSGTLGFLNRKKTHGLWKVHVPERTTFAA